MQYFMRAAVLLAVHCILTVTVSHSMQFENTAAGTISCTKYVY